MMHHSSRVHLTRDSVYAQVCKEDVASASKPITRFASQEYLRALNSQVQRFDDVFSEVPEKTLYLIDKMVRLRTKEAKFGFDHSEVLNLERELLEPFVEGTNELKVDRGELDESQFSKKLLERLSHTVPGSTSPGLNFEDWKRKKEAEMRLKTKLIEDAIQEEVQKRIDQEEDRQHKIEESQRKTEEWTRQKDLEAKLRYQENEQRRLESEQLADERKRQGEDQFKKWLKENFLKLRESKHQEKVTQKTEQLKAAERLRQEEERRWQCEQQFQQWLHRKNAQMNCSTGSVVSKPGRTKKPIMLAYSPNRKLKGSSSPTSLDNPSKYTTSEVDLVRDLSSAEEMKSSRSSASSKRLKKVKKPMKRGKAKRADDVQPIDELSSIQRTSHQGGHFASGEEDVEGFIYSGNEDESNGR